MYVRYQLCALNFCPWTWAHMNLLLNAAICEEAWRHAALLNRARIHSFVLRLGHVHATRWLTMTNSINTAPSPWSAASQDTQALELWARVFSPVVSVGMLLVARRNQYERSQRHDATPVDLVSHEPGITTAIQYLWAPSVEKERYSKKKYEHTKRILFNRPRQIPHSHQFHAVPPSFHTP